MVEVDAVSPMPGSGLAARAWADARLKMLTAASAAVFDVLAIWTFANSVTCFSTVVRVCSARLGGERTGTILRIGSGAAALASLGRLLMLLILAGTDLDRWKAGSPYRQRERNRTSEAVLPIAQDDRL